MDSFQENKMKLSKGHSRTRENVILFVIKYDYTMELNKWSLGLDPSAWGSALSYWYNSICRIGKKLIQIKTHRDTAVDGNNYDQIRAFRSDEIYTKPIGIFDAKTTDPNVAKTIVATMIGYFMGTTNTQTYGHLYDLTIISEISLLLLLSPENICDSALTFPNPPKIGIFFLSWHNNLINLI